jgi:UPF0716 protein FxsA
VAFSFIPFLLLVIPIAEIAAFIAIGSQIGVVATLLMILVTAVIGSVLLRVQGFGLISRIQSEMQNGRAPTRELIHGVMILVAGVLLLTPGFITDTLGFLLFVPAIRDAAWRFLRSRITIIGAGPARGNRGGFDDGRGFRPNSPEPDPVIDLDAEDYQRDPDPKSPWNENSRR